jgi:hypothetical protein
MFLSVGFWLLDLPHLIVTSIKKCTHDKSTPFVDSYAFDLGYHMSYALTVLQIGMLYGCIVPIIPAFCVIFFSFKYYVDKYNLSFVYHSEFLGVGKVKRRIIPLTIFTIFLQQLIIVGYFQGIIVDHKDIYFKLGSAVILLELLVVIGVRYRVYTNKRTFYKQ